jgi:hypothetical protein
VIAFFFLSETYLPVLLHWRAEHLRQLTGDTRYVSEHSMSASFIKRIRVVLHFPQLSSQLSRSLPSSEHTLSSSTASSSLSFRALTTSSSRPTTFLTVLRAHVLLRLRSARLFSCSVRLDSTAGPAGRQSTSEALRSNQNSDSGQPSRLVHYFPSPYVGLVGPTTLAYPYGLVLVLASFLG